MNHQRLICVVQQCQCGNNTERVQVNFCSFAWRKHGGEGSAAAGLQARLQKPAVVSVAHVALQLSADCLHVKASLLLHRQTTAPPAGQMKDLHQAVTLVLIFKHFTESAATLMIS